MDAGNIILLVIGIILIALNSIGYFYRRETIVNSVEVEAIVVRINEVEVSDPDVGSSTEYVPICKYTYNEKEYETPGGRQWKSRFNPGDIITIKVNRDEPERIITPGQAKEHLIREIIGITIGFGFIVGGFLIEW